MNIIVNGENRQVPDRYSAENLVSDMELTGNRVAMEANREIVPRSSYAEHWFVADDKIEIVSAIGGG
ncbi:MAG TPA: sulfur carrier protein ThiS [Gammaproteobacteria bacterium]|nr:sulfur carrier protein ThiS [Gammaproteobacteria bacterium]